MKKALKPEYVRYATAETERVLSDRIGLPWFEGMQGWDLIAADSSRVSEFLAIYENDSLDDEERFALMPLIVASLDISIEEPHDLEKDENWIKCKTILIKESSLHITTIHYWSLLGEEVKEGFLITKYIRSIWEHVKPYFN